jgi:D-alanyl-D-alanine carboxypeptidase
MRRCIGQLQWQRCFGYLWVTSCVVGVALLIAGFSSGETTSTSATPPGTTPGSAGLKPINRAALQAAVDTTAKKLLVPGAVVLLSTPQGKFMVTYGTTKLGAKAPPRAGTHFRIASNTKTMTAAVILQLAQEGKLSLTEPISKYVPGVPNGGNITIAELLNMRSGLYNYTDAPEFSATLDRNPAKVWTPEELLAIAFKRPPNFPPGTAFQYCNTNYALLGLVVEKVDGRPLAKAMQHRLFRPLGLHNTLLPAATTNTIPKPFSHGYLYGSTSVALVGTPPYSADFKAAAIAGKVLPHDYTNLNHSFAAAAGGVISTSNDLAAWIRALVSGRVLNPAYQRRWQGSLQPEDPNKPNGQQYGYGIAQMRWGPNAIYFHGGETPGYNSFIGYDPTNRVTLVVWTNLTVALNESPTANALMLKVLDQIYAVSPLAPGPSAAAKP